LALSVPRESDSTSWFTASVSWNVRDWGSSNWGSLYWQKWWLFRV